MTVTEAKNLKIGDRVKWLGSPGTVISKSAVAFEIKWDDGTTPMIVGLRGKKAKFALSNLKKA
jgi:hypothetical protein